MEENDTQINEKGQKRKGKNKDNPLNKIKANLKLEIFIFASDNNKVLCENEIQENHLKIDFEKQVIETKLGDLIHKNLIFDPQLKESYEKCLYIPLQNVFVSRKELKENYGESKF